MPVVWQFSLQKEQNDDQAKVALVLLLVNSWLQSSTFTRCASRYWICTEPFSDVLSYMMF